MALDWSKEISFSGLRKRTPKTKTTYPTKRYINLTVRKERTNDVRKIVPTAIILALLVALFAKFGVYDFFERVNQKSAELNAQSQLLAGYASQLERYDEVKAEYDAYESTRLASGEEEVSAMEAMELVDDFIAPVASIESIDYQTNTITLSLVSIDLDGVGELVSTLYEQEIVANVSVSTAAADTTEEEAQPAGEASGEAADKSGEAASKSAASAKSDDLTAAMVITLKKAEGAGNADV